MDEKVEHSCSIHHRIQFSNETLNDNPKKFRRSIEHTDHTECLSAIFKLNLDCFFSIFDWLSLKDLIAIASTCKQMQQIAGKFYQINYQAKSARAENDGIYLSRIPANIFSKFIRYLPCLFIAFQ